MRTLRSIVAVAVTAAVGVISVPFAQATSGEAPTFDELRTPPSPAFVLLGVEPANIERPTTPKELAATLFSAARDGENLIPKNYALEVAPFWLGTAAQQNLTFSAYHTKPRIGWDTFIQNFSISAATSIDMNDTDSGDDQEVVGAGIGMRTILLWGDVPPKLMPAANKITGLHSQVNAEIARLLGTGKSLSEIQKDPSLLLKNLEGQLDAAAAELQKIETQREGWTIGLAAAATGKFPESSTSDADFSRAGFWLTPSFTPPSEGWGADLHNFELGGVARYLHDQEGENENLVDLGGRLTLQYHPATLSLEAVQRIGIDSGESGDTHRVVGVFEYKIADGKYLTASFGQDFEEGDRDRLVSIFGVNFGFGNSILPVP